MVVIVDWKWNKAISNKNESVKREKRRKRTVPRVLFTFDSSFLFDWRVSETL